MNNVATEKSSLIDIILHKYGILYINDTNILRYDICFYFF